MKNTWTKALPHEGWISLPVSLFFRKGMNHRDQESDGSLPTTWICCCYGGLGGLAYTHIVHYFAGERWNYLDYSSLTRLVKSWRISLYCVTVMYLYICLCLCLTCTCLFLHTGLSWNKRSWSKWDYLNKGVNNNMKPPTKETVHYYTHVQFFLTFAPWLEKYINILIEPMWPKWCQIKHQLGCSRRPGLGFSFWNASAWY